ncbi:MAG: DUF503 family protein [Pseudomonadales bacterium]
MKVALLTVLIRLPGCRSLKEKRGRLGGLRERYGRNTQVAVCETDHNDDHDLAGFGFVATAVAATVVERILTDIETNLPMRVDGEVVSMRREWLR